jgi:hypothetical protein
MTINAIEATEAVVRAVARIDMPAEGPCEDLYCPFGCGWEEYRQLHAADCPVALAKALLE